MIQQSHKPKKTASRSTSGSVKCYTRKQIIQHWCLVIVVFICVIALTAALVNLVREHIKIQHVQQDQEQLLQSYDFNPGNIISDDNFFNSSAMTRDEVQSFLDDQGGDLASMTFDTEDMSGDSICSDWSGAQGESAALIIADSATACGISQKVLLTMLQKEQHLVTATDPSDFQLKSAMGLSCPDDDSCDPAYAGFFRQVYGAAKRFRYYIAHERRYDYHAGRLNYIQYNPIASCGGSDVYIENTATALLYIYTPYQPNEAALAAGSGTGDDCSSYGNRNFDLIYNTWFGDPRA